MPTILIIEDHFGFAYMLANHLTEKSDFNIAGVYHYVGDALKGIHELRPDIVVVDAEFDGSNCIELIKRAKLFNSEMKYLVLAKHDDEATALSALRAGANGYILKSAGTEKIIEALYDLSNGGSPVSSFVFSKLIKHFSSSQRREKSNCRVLSFREKEIMQEVSRGLLQKEIANRLGIQPETVKKHLSKIYGKLNVQNKIEALNKFYE